MRPLVPAAVVAVGALLHSLAASAGEISGEIYDSNTADPVAGAAVLLFFDETDPLTPGQLVSDDLLGPGQQRQVTRADGDYQFDAPAGRIYRIAVDVGSIPFSFPSGEIPPRVGTPESGAVVPNADAQSGGNQRSYHLTIEFTAASDEVTNNHIPLDRLSDAITLEKRADKPTASTGDIVSYTLVLTNRSSRDLLAVSGRSVSIIDAPARGLSYIVGSAIARVSQGSDRGSTERGFDSIEDPSGLARLVRFGPFDLPAGAVLTIHYQVTVGVDTRPGRYSNRAVAVDPGGVELSNRAVAQVQLVPDRDLETSVVLGRVFCDADGNRAFDSGETGVFGARVYVDTGSYAVSDSAGLFHLSRIEAGSHLVKIDEDSLAGGKVLGDETRLLRLTEGLGLRVSFPVECSADVVTIDHPNASITHSKLRPVEKKQRPRGTLETERVTVSGEVVLLQLSVDDKPVVLPTAAATIDAPVSVRIGGKSASPKQGVNLVDVPKTGYGVDRPRWNLSFSAPAGIDARRWTFVIREVDANEKIGSLFFSVSGRGDPPGSIAWDGRGDNGTLARSGRLYAAQLTVIGSARNAEAASAHAVFGVAYGVSAQPARSLVWRGALFSGTAKAPSATKNIEANVTQLAGGIGPNDRIEVEVHWDGSGDRLPTIARTQREARALVDLFIAAGIKSDKITARGRGSLDPVGSAKTRAGRARNRRVTVSVIPPAGAGAGDKVLTTLAVEADAIIEGVVLVVDNRGRFRRTVAVPARGAILVDVRALDGRRSAIDVEIVPGSLQPNGTTPHLPITRVAIKGDLARESIQVGQRILPPELLRVDAELVTSSGAELPNIETKTQGRRRNRKRVLEAPLEFSLVGPEKLQVRSWSFAIRDAAGTVVGRTSGSDTVVTSYTWDGTDDDGALILRGNERYSYVLSVELSDGSRGSSPERHFTVDRSSSFSAIRATGSLFTAAGKPSTRLKNQLSQFVARAGRRPAAERYSISLSLSKNTDAGAAESRTSAARDYLTRLGLARGRFDISSAVLPDARRDALEISALRPEQPARESQLLVNGVARAVSGDSFDSKVEVPSGGAIVLDVTTPTGNRARYFAAAPGAAAQGQPAGEAGDPLITPRARVFDTDRKTDFSAARAAQLRVVLPKQGTVLPSPHVPIRGTTDPTNRITINGDEVHVRADGSFSFIARVPAGKTVLAIRARDRDGYVSTVKWPVRVAADQTFVMAFGEGIATSSYTARGWFGDTAYLSGMNEDTTLAAGQALLHARAVLYIKSRFSAGTLFDEVRITTHVDTGKRRGAEALFENLVDPQRDYPVYGDSSTEVRDVNSRGKLYLRVDAGDSKAVIGSIKTSVQGGSLFRYDRTFDGAVVKVKKDVGSDHTAEVFAFGTRERTDHVRDINLFRATGGSLYYLRNGNVFEGSEQVRVIVRDRDNAMPLSERVLVRNQDYTIDYTGGRILMNEPVASSAAGASVLDNFESGAMPLDGHPVYVEVAYEHQAERGVGQRSGGIYARDKAFGRVTIGAGAMVEERNDGDDYSLWGVDARYKAGARSIVRAEVAGSDQLDAANVISQDGGLTFQDLNGVPRLTETARDGQQLGWKVSARLTAEDFTSTPVLSGTTLRVYAQELDRGFSSGGNVLEQGRLKFGGTLAKQFGPHDIVSIRHQAEVAQLPRVGPTADDVDVVDPLFLDERASVLTSAQWAHQEGRWNHQIEAAHQRLTSTGARAPDPNGDFDPALDARRLGVGARTQFAYTNRLTLRAAQQIQLNLENQDPTLTPIEPMSTVRDDDYLAGVTSSIGSDVRLTEGLSLSADYYQRWNGDNAARLGFRSALNESGSVYVAEQFGARDGDLVSTTVVGAQDRFGEGGAGKTYGEYQIDHGVLGQRNRALLGLGHRWRLDRGLHIGVGLEHQQTFGGFLPDGTPIGNNQRNVVHGGLDYTLPDRLKIGTQAELRIEEGLGGSGIDDLVRTDPRLSAPEGTYPDHGGTAPGAPLVIPPGERLQLVLGAGADWRVSRDLTLFSRLRWSRTLARDSELIGDTDDRAQAAYAEGALGWAYRPLDHDWLTMLARYSFLLDRRPLDDLLTGRQETTHAVAMTPMVELPWRLRLSGKFAFKTTLSENLAFEDAVIESSAEAVLALVRLGVRVFGNWDVTAEYRHLFLFKPLEREQKSGSVWELGYSVGRHLRIGAGYNLSRFSDDELRLERDSHGFFIRITGHY